MTMKTALLALLFFAACDGSTATTPGGDAGSDVQLADGGQQLDTIPGVDTVPAERPADGAIGGTGGSGDSHWHEVIGGTFLRNGDPALPATVSTFKLDDYEVTVRRFRKFIEINPYLKLLIRAGAGENPNVPGSGWWPSWDVLLPYDVKMLLYTATPPTFTMDALGGHEDLPITGTNWAEALAFCIWDGGRLPTDLEWQYAASGGDKNYTYPWGNTTPDSSHASFNCSPPCTLSDIGLFSSKPAGATRWGQLNMSGNMSEWTFDGYDPAVPPPVPCVNCATLPETLKLRRVRGGNAASTASDITASAVTYADAASTPSYIGFRCAR
jgi:formylglycine-generating enzyme